MEWKVLTIDTITIWIRIETLYHIICQLGHNSIYLQPIIQPFILTLIKPSNPLILDILELKISDQLADCIR